jgi:hypothetical protein
MQALLQRLLMLLLLWLQVRKLDLSCSAAATSCW